jgi:hypothetical protein
MILSVIGGEELIPLCPLPDWKSAVLNYKLGMVVSE